MKLLILLSSLMIVKAGVVPDECDGVTISGVYHDRELLYQGLGKPYLLAVDYSTNNLYFSYTKNDDIEGFIFQTARLNLITKDLKDIEGVVNGFAQTVDPVTNEIYIGGSNGIYKYNTSTNKGQFIGAKDVNIWTLFYKDVLFYTTYPSQFLFTLIDGKSTRFVDLEDTKVDNFIIDDANVMFFNNDTGMYSQVKGTKDAIAFQGNFDSGVRAMTGDKNGNIYIAVHDGILKVNKEIPAVEEVVNLEDVYGVAFDNDNNMIYADSTMLIRLKPNHTKKC